jgi:lysophospholipase
MSPVEHVIQTHDGIDLISRRFEPGNAAFDGRSLVIVHGASEHGGRYDHVARLFADRGWTVIVGDNRGHGRSHGVPMHVHRFSDYLNDLDAVWEYHGLNPARTALMGHSFGSLIAARFAETRPNKQAALVLLAPLLRLKVHVNPLIVAWGKLVSLFAPRIRFESRVDPRDTTRDELALVAREADPLIHRSVTCGWFFEMKAALKAVWADAAQIQVPVLIAQGEADRIVDPKVVRPFLETISSRDKELRLYPDHYHELHNEPEWQSIITGIAEWLEVRVRIGSAAGIVSPTAPESHASDYQLTNA